MMEHALPTRSAWLRILQFPLTRLIVLGGGLFYLMAWSEARINAVHDHPVLGVAVAIVLALVAMAIYFAWGRVIERREVTELSTTKAGREFFLGALIGAGLITGCALGLMLLGMYRIEGLNPVSYMIPAMAMAVKASVFEELVFRGVLFRSVEDMGGSWTAVLVSSLFFGGTHLLNPSATMTAAVYIGIEAGLLFAGAYLMTQRLWIVIGMHMLWNFVQSAVFSGVVSGDVALPGLFRQTTEGPAFITGGAFGMEQSIFALILCSTAGIVMLAIAGRRGHLQPAPWNGGRRLRGS